MKASFAKGLAIRFARHGCANRPFYHVVVMPVKDRRQDPPLEQLGVYDPIENEHNEKLVALDFQRIKHWLGQGVRVSRPVAELLGLSGFFPIHPRSYMNAWRNRRKERELSAKDAAAENEASKETPPS